MSIFLPAHDATIIRRRRNRLIVAGLAVLAVALIWTFGAGRFRDIHRRKILADAEAYAAQNRTPEALASARKAFRLGSFSARTLRLLVDLEGRAGSPEALKYWVLLARSPEVNLDDHRMLLRWAVRWGQQRAADLQWIELQKEDPIPLASLRVAAGYFEMRGEAERAVKSARAVIAEDPGDVETRILLGRVLLRDGSATDQAIGKRLLMEQMDREDGLGIAVLRHLAESRALFPYEAEQCLRALEKSGRREKSDELTTADLQIQMTPYRKEQILEETARDFVASGGPTIEAGRWLMRHKAFKLLLKLLSPEAMVESREVALLYFDALVSLGEWAKIEEKLASSPPVIDGLERSLYRARAAVEMNQPRLAELHWKQARDQAGKEARSLLLLAGYAKQARNWAMAEEALRTLAEQPLFARRALEELCRVFEEKGDNARLRALLAEMLGRYPDDPAIQNDLAYIDLLDGREIERSLKTAEELVKKNPHYLAYRATLALARLRQGRDRDARAVLEIGEVDWPKAQPAQQAIYAAALGGTAGDEEAREFCRKIPIGLLKPEERALVAKWL